MLRIATLLTGGVLLFGLLCGPVTARDNDGGNNDAGGGGRDSLETVVREYIDLHLPARSKERVIHLFLTKLRQRSQEHREFVEKRPIPSPRQVTIEAKIVEVTDVNKLDLSDIPLFGDLVGPEFNGDDMTEENKVGNVYSTGEGGLFVVLQPTALGDPGQLNLGRLIVFNDDYSHEVKPLQVSVVPTVNADRRYVTMQLGTTLAELPSVRSVTQVETNVSVPDGGTILLGGLTRQEVESDERQVPYLSDVPVLNRMFRGTAHQDGKANLLILIKPSVLIQEE